MNKKERNVEMHSLIVSFYLNISVFIYFKKMFIFAVFSELLDNNFNIDVTRGIQIHSS